MIRVRGWHGVITIRIGQFSGRHVKTGFGVAPDPLNGNVWGCLKLHPPIPSTVWCSDQRTRVVLYRAILLGELILNVEGCRNIGLLKVRVTALHACAGTERRCRYRQSIRNAALEGSAWSAPLFRHFTPGKDGYSLYRRLGGPRGRSGRVLKISPPDRSARSCWRPLKIIFFFPMARQPLRGPGRLICFSRPHDHTRFRHTTLGRTPKFI